MELVFIALVIAGIVWLVMRGRRRDAEANEATLSRAWRIVLDDPNYEKRRAIEERSRTLGDGG